VIIFYYQLVVNATKQHE